MSTKSITYDLPTTINLTKDSSSVESVSLYEPNFSQIKKLCILFGKVRKKIGDASAEHIKKFNININEKSEEKVEEKVEKEIDWDNLVKEGELKKYLEGRKVLLLQSYVGDEESLYTVSDQILHKLIELKLINIESMDYEDFKCISLDIFTAYSVFTMKFLELRIQ